MCRLQTPRRNCTKTRILVVMKKMCDTKKILLKQVLAGLLLFQFFLGDLHAQQNADAHGERLKESVQLHLPVRGYMPGDFIWFKIYVADGSFKQISPISKVAYIELTDSDGTIVWQSKVALENGTGYGSWRIPPSSPTGVYLMKGYTRQQLVSGVPVQAESITILNPFRGILRPLQQPIGKAGANALPMGGQIVVNGLKAHYRNREAVQVAISGETVSSVSVAVYKMDSLETLLGEQLSFEQEYAFADADWPAEYGGHLVRGNVTDRNGKPLVGIRVFLSLPGKRFYFNSSVSDAAGRVYFEVRDVFGTEQVIAYPAAAEDSGVVITLDNPFYQLPVQFNQVPILVGPEQKASLDQRTTEHSLRQLYGQSVPPQYFYPWQQDTTAFFGDPDKVYFLDDYTRFRTLEEVFREYVPEVELRKIQGDFRLKMLNQPFRRSFDGNPLVLLDGVAVNDINRLMTIDPLKIRKLELVTRRYYLGDMAFEGILCISTYEGDLGGFPLGRGAVLLDYPTLQLQQQFTSPMYNTAQSLNSRTPDLRNHLLWEPEATVDETGTIPVFFYAGDLTGEFVVDIKGYSTSGKLIHERRSFRVDRK